MVKKDQAVNKLMEQLRTVHGDDSVMLAKDMPRRPAISSGSLALDYAIGIGGFPSDRLMEIAGAEGTGKTTLGIQAMANALDKNPDRAALILDFEHKLDYDWITQLIGEERTNRVILTWPTYAEEGTNLYADAVGGNEKKKIAPGQVCFAMWDSIAAAPTIRRNEDYEVAAYGGNSLAIKDFANLAAALSHKYECCTVGINQVREDFSGYHQHKVPGGRAWLHACALRLLTKKGKGKAIEKINGEDFQVGYEVACKVVKNGLAAPGRTANWWFYNVATPKHAFGVDLNDEIIRLGMLTQVIERKGAYYNHPALPGGKVMGQDALAATINADESLKATFRSEVMAALQTGAFAQEVAPMSVDPEAPIPETVGGFANLLAEPDFAEEQFAGA